MCFQGYYKSFPNGTAPGPSGLRASHLNEAISCPSPDRSAHALRALTDLVHVMSAGNIPSEVIPHLCGATLLANRKKDGGLRPIAVGEVLRRLTSKCLARHVQEDAIHTLAPLQLGVGVKGGCEAIIHSVANIHEDISIPHDQRWTLLLDFSNAFNSIDRGCMFEEIRSRLPSLATWMECCYGSKPILHLEDQTILSCCGVQQGDPLGPLGFSLTLQPLVEKIMVEVPDLLCNAWYLDDGTLCGSPADLAKALRIIEQDGPCRGLKLNRSKSLLYAHHDADTSVNNLPPEIPICRDGFNLLGCPIAFCEASLLKRVNKIKDIVGNLRDLGDAQCEATLLRSCLALPKVSYALRCCPPSYIKSACQQFDNSMIDALSDLSGSPLSDWAQLKASLPSSLGGLNIRRACLHASAAYISSIVQSQDLVSGILQHTPSTPLHLEEAISISADAAGKPDWTTLEEVDVSLHQRALSASLDSASFEHLLSTAQSPRFRALALACALPHAGAWLNVIPSTSMGLHMQDREFRVCLQYWLGLRMFDDDARCPICNRIADNFGDHHVG